MFLSVCLLITLLYYLILWRVYAKKAAFDRAAKEVFGPATGVQELLAQQQQLKLSVDTQKTEGTQLVDTKDIFGPITDLKSLMETPAKSATSPPLEKTIQASLSQQLTSIEKDLQIPKIKTSPTTPTIHTPLINTHDRNAQIEELYQFFE